MTMKKKTSRLRFISEAKKMMTQLFGETIEDKQMSVGIYDLETDKALWDDEPKEDRDWSDPAVVDE